MLRVFLLIFIIIMAIFGYLYHLNPQDTQFFLIPGYPIRLPLVFFLFISLILGGVLIYLILGVANIGRAYGRWSEKRALKYKDEAQRLYSRGLDRFFQGERELARIDLERSLELDGGFVPAHQRLADIYSLSGEYEKAKEQLDRAILLAPKNREILFQKSQVLQDMGSYPVAIETLKELVKMEERDLKTLRELRNCYIQTRSWKEASEVQKRVIKQTPGEQEREREAETLVGIDYEYAKQLWDLSQGGEAIRMLSGIIKRRRDFIPAYLFLGEIYSQQGRVDRCILLWEKSFYDLGNLSFLLKLEEFYLKREEPEKILRLYEKSLSRGDDPVVRFFYGRLLLRLDRMEEAITQLEKVKEAGIENPAIDFLLGDAYCREQRFSEGSRFLKQALDLAPQIRISFLCQECGAVAGQEWTDYCAKCRHWNTYRISLKK